MLHVIVFDSTTGLGLKNNPESQKQYTAPCDQNKKEDGKRRNLGFGPNNKNKKGKMKDAWSGVVSLGYVHINDILQAIEVSPKYRVEKLKNVTVDSITKKRKKNLC